MSFERQWVSLSWYSVVASGDEKHLAAGTNVQTVRTFKGAVAYAAKYCGKVCDFLDLETGELRSVGRFWGILGRVDFPATRVVYSLSEEDYHRLRRVMRRVWGGVPDGRKLQGFTVYMAPKTWRSVLAWLAARDITLALPLFTRKGVLPTAPNVAEMRKAQRADAEWIELLARIERGELCQVTE